ncbi:clathrin heavy chain [Thalassiosira pseudonana CCMP1335]|uniref:Clathrin heavy chain n=1 Tax=Thalassiosira pseudonana TaxID=35128 RepID=B8C8U9_THAPS|nr:clathrin heavy chain [Thalassiosira pseudonana CCMP1335]EED90126.1 clathrin heavy chain [Thalassiosira pseudonana CCMP1335]
MAGVPIAFSEVLNLQQLGIPETSIKHGLTTMESDKWIVSVEPTQVSLIDLQNQAAVTRRPIKAEAAVMNPSSNILALRSGKMIQMFNLDTKQKLKSHDMDSPIVFWKWTSADNLALVTATSVHHWSSTEGSSAPTKMFDRHPTIGPNTQIINYQVSPDSKWCLLGGISANPGGGVNGNMQLYSVEKKVSQPLQGHAGAFHKFKVSGREDEAQVLVFHEKKSDDPAHKLFVMEVGRDPSKGQPFRIPPTVIPVPPEAAADFPVSLVVDAKDDVAFLLSKMGFVYMFDIQSGKTMFRTRITQETVFVTCSQSSTGAVFGITVRTGKVLRISLNGQNLVPYIVNTLRDNDLAIKVAGRLGLPGAEHLYTAEFERLISAGQVKEAAVLVANSGSALRTPQTIARFQQIPAQPGAPQPVFQYFSTLLENVKLNEQESIELAKPVLQQGRPQLMEKWLKDDKLHCSEALGDLIMPHDTAMALSVYLRSECHAKAIQCFVQRGEYDKIVPYSTSVGYSMDYSSMLSQLLFNNPQGALDLAKGLVSAEGGPLIDIQATAEAFLSSNRVQETTAFLLEALKDNKQEHAYLQTKLLEINLIGGAPQVADAIMQNGILTHYDKAHVGKLCERAGMWQRAAEHYTDINDIKRVFKNSHQMNPEFVVTYFGKLNRDQSIALLKDMLSRGPTNMQVCVEVAKKYHEELGASELVKVFEANKATEGLYYFLGAVVNFSEDSVVHFKYIQSACMLGQFKEAERVCRDSNIYDPAEVKEYLKNAKLPDPRPLIHVCDRFDFVDELTEYLYLNSLLQYVEVYVTKVSPTKTPQVVGKLFDLGANQDFVKRILMAVGTACPVDEMVEIAETRNRLRMLQPWLEARVATGSTEPGTHNALGKIYIQMNKDPKAFLTNNMFYEPKVLGPFCESLDPSLAFVAYKKGAGECDDELIKISFTHGLYRDLARYLVERQDLELWAKSATEKESQRRQLIDQVVEWALPESTSADEVSCTVKAFMAADLPGELITLLERIILQGSDFSDNKNLQNLLILTAIRADHTRVASYIDQLDNFDAKDIALICVSESHMLYEEAYSIYNKFAKPEFTQEKEEQVEMQVLAIGVLVDFMKDLDRAKGFANQVDEKPVWSKLGKSQLEEKMAAEAILSFINAEDASEYVKVCAEANEAEIYTELIPFLKMARKGLQENLLDTELIYAYAKTNNLTELEVFVNGPNVSNIQNIGDRCFSEGLYHAAKLLYTNINNNSKLALCHIHLEEYREAVAAATKANNVSTWKQVCFACLKADEFRLASTCGLEVIKYPDHLDEVVTFYSDLGHFDHLISLFEQGLGLEDAHIGIFTELGILYTKHVPDKVMEHCKVFFSKLNVSKVVRACERARLWAPAVYLYMADKQFDNAVKVMSERANSFDNDLFLDSIVKVRNAEIMYKAVNFYLTMHPTLFTRLMEVLEDHVDHSRVVNQLRRTGDWALQIGQAYMKSVQKANLSAVNEALNELYIEDEDYESLRKSIDKFKNFNMIALASKLATHELLEFRRISAYVYRCNSKWSQSIELSKNDRMWKDCIDTANESADAEIIENLLRFFCETSEKECFCAALYTCFAHVRPDVVLELGWLNGYHNFIMPFFIQNMRQTHDRLRALEERTKPPKEDENQDLIAQTYSQLGGFNNMLMLENAPGGGMPGMPPQHGGGIDMSGFANAGGMQLQPGMMPNGGMPQPGMMPNGGMY